MQKLYDPGWIKTSTGFGAQYQLHPIIVVARKDVPDSASVKAGCTFSALLYDSARK